MAASTVRAWIVALLALVAAGAGISSLSSGGGVASLVRMAVAAAVLAAYSSAAAIVTTARAVRTRWRCLLWGATVPTLVGLLNALLVVPLAGVGRGAASLAPWVVGSVAVAVCGSRLPAVRLPAWLRNRTRKPSTGPAD